MLEMPIRTGRRMQDAARQIRENYSRRTNERQQVNSLHRQRMTCSDSMRSFTNTQDWMNGMSIIASILSDSCSMVLVAITAGTPQPNPKIIGMNAFP